LVFCGEGSPLRLILRWPLLTTSLVDDIGERMFWFVNGPCGALSRLLNGLFKPLNDAMAFGNR
jgi:hypothetical protein